MPGSRARVNLKGQVRSLLPRELGGSPQPECAKLLATFWVQCDPSESIANFGDPCRINQLRGIASYLRHRAVIAGYHRGAEGHRFENRQAEPLLERGKRERQRV